MSPGACDIEDTMSVVGSSQDDEGATVEASFADFCKTGLGMGENIVNEAVTVFREFKPMILADISATGSGSAERIEHYWTAFILYCLTKLREGEEKLEAGKQRLCLPLILRAANMNPLDFLRETQQLLLKAGYLLSTLYGSDWEKRLELKEMQLNFTHLKHLYNHYNRAYEEFFLSSGLNNGSQSIDSGNECKDTSTFLSDYHHFGWLLFLYLRVHVFCGIKDLVTCTNGLVAILAILMLHIPVRFRKFSILDSTRLVRKTDKDLDLLASLCEIYHTSEEDLKAAMLKTNDLIVEVLKIKPLPASESDSENLLNINTDGLLYFKDLFKEESLKSNMLVLHKDYNDAIRHLGEFDECNLDNFECNSIAAGNPSLGANNLCSAKLNLGLMSSPSKTMTSSLSPPCSPASPAVGIAKVAPTPVSAAMTTAKWLRTIISPLPSKPTMELEQFLSSCDTDVTADVTCRANIILDAIFPCCSSGDRTFAGVLQNISLMDSTWAEQRKSEALKLYYRVLEAICRAESQILNGNNLTALLSNERFHRCMLACSAELVLATHKTITMIFPAVLEKTGITAFDLSKVIESFVRHEDTLPRELKRHLNSLEERLLESMVWEKGSSMYNSLIVAKPSFSAEITKLALLAEPMPSLDSVVVYPKISNGVLTTCPSQKRELPSDCNGDLRSPKRPCTEIRSVLVERNSFDSPSKEHLLGFSSPRAKLPHLQSAFATPTRINPTRGGETCAETGMNIFFGKILKLAAIRIKSLSDKLQLSQQILERVYCLFQQIINQRTSLFFNRHIDQIILCCFYGVAKVSQLSLTFKEIISRYRKQPHCKTQVFRSVFVDWSVTGHSGKKGQAHLDIITFYNAVFIPLVKPLLMELSSGSTLRNNCSSEDGNKADGQVLGSPRSSPFPRLPDMSPKKVSASHNVYVSPLRASKMDSLLSPSSKSYYACVGESTHAYESPSRDLTAINNRLNSGRKMRLNFDVVSDSLVAGSLCPQNGSTTAPSATGADTINSVVKCEQPDS